MNEKKQAEVVARLESLPQEELLVLYEEAIHLSPEQLLTYLRERELIESRGAKAKANPGATDKIDTDNKPPKGAAFLLCCLLPKKDREPLLGDLTGEYAEICAEYGPRRARLWFWMQVFLSLGPLLSRAGGKLAKLAGLKWLSDFIGRLGS